MLTHACFLVLLLRLVPAALENDLRLAIGVKWRRTLSDEWHAAVTSGWAGRCRSPAEHGCLAVLLVGTLTEGPARPSRWPDEEPRLDAARQMLLLPIVDSYANLILKTLFFLRWAAGTGAPHVMVLDDDTYPDVRRLVSLLSRVPAPLARERFLMGEVCFGEPVRDASQTAHQNYLSPKCYPLRDLPPWTSGSGFVMSLDLARHLAANAPTLTRGTFFACGNHSGEDIQIALWLLALGVAPTHSSSFRQFPAVLPDTLVLLNMPRDATLLRALDAHVHPQRARADGGPEPLQIGGELVAGSACAAGSCADGGGGSWVYTSPTLHRWLLARPAVGPGRLPPLDVATPAGRYTFRNHARSTPTLLWASDSLEEALDMHPSVARAWQRLLSTRHTQAARAIAPGARRAARGAARARGARLRRGGRGVPAGTRRRVRAGRQDARGLRGARRVRRALPRAVGGDARAAVGVRRAAALQLGQLLARVERLAELRRSARRVCAVGAQPDRCRAARKCAAAWSGSNVTRRHTSKMG